MQALLTMLAMMSMPHDEAELEYGAAIRWASSAFVREIANRFGACRSPGPLELEAAVIASVIQLELVKPGVRPEGLELHLHAGSDGYVHNATYSVRRKTVLVRGGSAVAQSDDGLHARVFGLAFEWIEEQPNSAPQPVSMAQESHEHAHEEDAELEETKHHSAVIEHKFTLSLDCNRSQLVSGGPAGNGSSCARDGDKIESTFYFEMQAENGKLSVADEVRIATDVRAKVSCELTKPTLEVLVDTALDGILPNGPLSVHLRAVDVDGEPVSFNRADLELTWDGEVVPFRWRHGENDYSWKIPTNREAGVHQIEVNLKNPAEGGQCSLLPFRTLTVVSDLMQLIVAGCVAGVVVLVMALILFFAWKHRHRVQGLLFSLVSYEGILSAEVSIEAWYGNRSSTIYERRPRTIGLCKCRDLFGDGTLVNAMVTHRRKPWVGKLIIPYAPKYSHARCCVSIEPKRRRYRCIICFALACAVSLVSIVTKGRFLFSKLRSRCAHTGTQFRRNSILSGKESNVVVVPADVLARSAAASIDLQLERSTFERNQHVVDGLLAIFEVCQYQICLLINARSGL
jgi:hypothetical protein